MHGYLGSGGVGVIKTLKKPVWGYKTVVSRDADNNRVGVSDFEEGAIYSLASAKGIAFQNGEPSLVNSDGVSGNGQPNTDPVFKLDLPQRADVFAGNYIRAAAESTTQEEFDDHIIKIKTFFAHADAGAIGQIVDEQIKEDMSHAVSSAGSGAGSYKGVVEGLVPHGTVGEYGYERLPAKQRNTIVDFLGKCGKIFETSGPIWKKYAQGLLWGQVVNSYHGTDAYGGDDLKHVLANQARANTTLTANDLYTHLDLRDAGSGNGAESVEGRLQFEGNTTVYAGILGYISPSELGSTSPWPQEFL